MLTQANVYSPDDSSHRIYTAEEDAEWEEYLSTESGKAFIASTEQPVQIDPGSYEHGIYKKPKVFLSRADSVRHVSRVNKLRDVLALVRNRGVLPDAHRQSVMLLTAGTISHLLPHERISFELRKYAVELCGEAWAWSDWNDKNLESEIVSRARSAEMQEQRTFRPSDLRSDPSISDYIAILKPTEAEMIGIPLRALRTNRARKTLERRKNNIPEKSKTDRVSASKKKIRPWVASGVSRAKFYREKRAAAHSARIRAKTLSTARLSKDAVSEIADIYRMFHEKSGAEVGRLCRGFLKGLPVNGFRPSGDLNLPEYVSCRFAAGSPGSERAKRRNTTLLRFGQLADPFDSLEAVFDSDWLDYLSYAHESGKNGDIPVSHLLALAEKCRDFRSLISALDECVAPTITEYDESHTFARETFPGSAVAGCSRSTWYSRMKQARDFAAASAAATCLTEVGDEDELFQEE
jgi:hypothetical protein